MAQHNDLGRRGELFAYNYLINEGYKIVNSNWKFKHEEVDLIAEDGEELVFVEVKTRTIAEHASADDVISEKKMRHLIDAADEYVSSKLLDIESRFDVIVLVVNDQTFNIDHIKNAFSPNY